MRITEILSLLLPCWNNF